MIDLKNHIAIVTGAGAGLGRGTAIALAECGATVAAIDIDCDNINDTVTHIKKAGGFAEAYQADVANSADIGSVLGRIKQSFGRVDSLVNVVGVEFYKDYLDISESDWDRQIAVNLKSVFLTCQGVVPVMQKQGGGSIVNTASVQAFATTGRTAPYAAAKGGIVAMSRDLAGDFGPMNIRVNTICPGCIHSPMLNRSYESPEARERGLSTLAQTLPLRRVGDARDFANLVLFLISPMSSYITGQTINVDGGMMCRLPLA